MENKENQLPQNQTEPRLEEKELHARDSALADTKTKKRLPQPLIYSLIALLFMLIGALGFWLYQQTRQNNNQLTSNEERYLPEDEKSVQPTDKQKDITTVISSSIQDKLFYTKDNNIFVYDVDSKQTSKLTDYPQNESYSPAYDESGKQKPNISIENIRVIDEKTLGFGKCGIVIGDFGCGMYVLNLETNQVIEKKKLDNNMLLLASDWHDPDTFSYLVTADEKWQVFLNTMSGLKTLEDITIETYGRGGYIEDSEKIRFSPDGKYVLQISTSSPRSVSDFNVYVYGVDSDTKKVIQNATQPEWVDNDKIVYRKYEKEGDGLYIYNIESQTQEKLQGIGKDSYNPEVLLGENKILYENNPDKQVWMYDLTTNDNTLVADMALSPIWLNLNKIIFSEIEMCNGKEGCGGMVDYEIKGMVVYDLSNKTKLSTTPELQSLYGTATEYH